MIRKALCPLALALALALHAHGFAQDKQTELAASIQTISFGDHQRQSVDYYPPKSSESRPPLILFIHGGGWRGGDRQEAVYAKPAHFNAKGYAFASIGYRVLPEAPVEVQAGDVGAGIAAVRSQADALGFDPHRIILMGHSSGAHLAALVAADPRYTGAHFDGIRGVVTLDCACYDWIGRFVDGSTGHPYTDQVFGVDPERLELLSPYRQLGGKDVANWLILYVEGRERSTNQSLSIGKKLTETGLRAEVIAVPDTDHGRINRELGEEGNWATSRVDDFLAAVFQ